MKDTILTGTGPSGHRPCSNMALQSADEVAVLSMAKCWIMVASVSLMWPKLGFGPNWVAFQHKCQ
jgi:hypothetical protein